MDHMRAISTLQLCVFGAVESEGWHGFAITHQHILSTLLSQVKTLLADGIHVDGHGQLHAKTSYESNVPFVLRFMVRPCATRTRILL